MVPAYTISTVTIFDATNSSSIKTDSFPIIFWFSSCKWGRCQFITETVKNSFTRLKL